MLLGALLIGAPIFIRRWLANEPSGIRRGFTAQRFSGKDKAWMNIGAATLGLAPQNPISPMEQGNDVHFGGGDSGGGGASRNF